MPATLPPLIQEFAVNSTAFVAGIDEMLGSLERLAAAIDEIGLSSEEMFAAADRAAAAADAGMASMSAAADKAAQSAAANADAQKAMSDAERAAADAAKFEADFLAELAVADARLAEAAAAVTDAMAVEARAIKLQGDAAEATVAKNTAAADSGMALGTHMKTAFLAVGVAVGYGLDQAAKFQTQVTRLYTAAGLTGAAMHQVSAEILKVGDATGYSGTQIAEALYHPVSAGLSLKAALAAVTYGAQLAQIHGASLDDTMYALSSVMKAFGIQASGAGHAAALLNAIVGQGDMRFQDFNQSVKNWAPTAASMGVSIQSMGAAIAYLTDRGNSAEVASTRLTMGLSMVTAGSKEANTFLRDLGLTSGDVALKNESLAKVMNGYGLTTNRIAADLKKPDGIYVALQDLQGAFHHAGLSAAQADQVMAKLFGGGRSDKAILSLMSNLDGLRQKYESIGKGVSDYGSSWAKTQQTVSYQWHQAVADVKNLAISFGEVLLPAALKVLAVLSKFMSFLQAHPAVAAFAGALVGLAVAFGVAEVASKLFTASLITDPVFLILAAIVALALGLYELYRHCALVREIVHDVAAVFIGAWHAAIQLAGAVVNWFVHGPLAFIKQQMAVFSQFWAAHGKQIEMIAKAAWLFISTVIITEWKIAWAYLRTGLTLLKDVWRVVWVSVRDTVRMVWDVIAAIIRTTMRLIFDSISFILDLITGHWGAAWHDLQHLASDAMHGAISIIQSLSSNFGTLLSDAGRALVHGLINGIESALGGLWSTIGSIGGGIISHIGGILGIHSPSRVMYEHGQMVALGLAMGIDAGAPVVESASRKLADSVYAPGGSGVPAGTGAGGTVIHFHLTVNGFIGNNDELVARIGPILQQWALRTNKRNANNGLSLAPGR